VLDTWMLLRDGRLLAFTDCGASSDPPVFYCHGAPGNRLDLVWIEDAFRGVGIRVVSADRPGYGGSSPHPGRGWNDWPDDLAALADHLSVERFAVMGWSSGGPYAVACASLLPERVTSAAIISGVTDMGWPDAWEGYDEAEATLMRIGDEAQAVAWCDEHYGPDGARFFSGPGDLPPADVAFLQDDAVSARWMPTRAEAFRRGIGGFAQDLTVQGRSWSFDPGKITAPTRVLHGEDDTRVPIKHSRHTAEAISRAALETFPGRGHLSMLPETPRVAAELIALK
jgi:pimeloyl-ACP methyl ester carboxylesterase